MNTVTGSPYLQPVTTMPEPQIHTLFSSSARKQASKTSVGQIENFLDQEIEQRSRRDMELWPTWVRLPPETCLTLARTPSRPGSLPPPGPWAPHFRSLFSQRNGRLPQYAGEERKAVDFVWENFMLVLFIISRSVMKSSKAKSITAMLREARAALWLRSNRQACRGEAPALSSCWSSPYWLGSMSPRAPLERFCQLTDSPAPRTSVVDEAWGVGERHLVQAGPIDSLSQEVLSGYRTSVCSKNRMASNPPSGGTASSATGSKRQRNPIWGEKEAPEGWKEVGRKEFW